MVDDAYLKKVGILFITHVLCVVMDYVNKMCPHSTDIAVFWLAKSS